MLRGFLLSILTGDCDPMWPESCGAPQAKDVLEEHFWTGSVKHMCYRESLKYSCTENPR